MTSAAEIPASSGSTLTLDQDAKSSPDSDPLKTATGCLCDGSWSFLPATTRKSLSGRD